MKKNKWLKWKIGAAASLGIALLFNVVKGSPEFLTAYLKAQGLTQTALNTEQDAAAGQRQRPHSRNFSREGQLGSDGSSESDGFLGSPTTPDRGSQGDSFLSTPTNPNRSGVSTRTRRS